MSSLRKFAPATRWPIVAALACAALAAGPGLAAGRHAPHHASQPAQGAGQGSSTSAGQAKPEGGNATGPIDTMSARDDAAGAGRPRQNDGQQVRRSDRPHAAGRRLRQSAPPRRAHLAHRRPEEVARRGAGRRHSASSGCRHRRAHEKCRRRGSACRPGPSGCGRSGKARARPRRIGRGIRRRQEQSRPEHERRAPGSGSRRDDAPRTQAAGDRDQRHEPAPSRSRYRRTGEGSLGDRRLDIPAQVMRRGIEIPPSARQIARRVRLRARSTAPSPP